MRPEHPPEGPDLSPTEPAPLNEPRVGSAAGHLGWRRSRCGAGGVQRGGDRGQGRRVGSPDLRRSPRLRATAGARRGSQGCVRVLVRSRPGDRFARRGRFHGGCVLWRCYPQQRCGAHSQRPGRRSDRPRCRAGRRHHRQRPHASLPPQEPRSPQPSQPAGLRAAGTRGVAGRRPRVALRGVHDPARVRDRLRARRRRALPEPARRSHLPRGSK